MRRILSAVAILIFIVSCSGGGANSQAEDQEQLKEMDVTVYNLYEDYHFSKAIAFNTQRQIDVLIEHYEYDIVDDRSYYIGSCGGTSTLTEADYEALVSVTAEADFFNETPDDECVSEDSGWVPGPVTMRANYWTMDGRMAWHQYGECPLDEGMAGLKTFVLELADKYVTSCNEEVLLSQMSE